MEDSFRVRVDKAFGFLASSSSNTSSSSLTSLWRLADEEIERREWNRDRHIDGPHDDDDDLEPKPYPPNLDGIFANQRTMMPSHNKPSNFRKEVESDLQGLDDYDDDRHQNDGFQRRGSSSSQSVKPDDHDPEEWDIRSAIGLDCTLDYEDEEDKYDKVAIGREKAGDRLYMRDITDYGAGINSYEELPNTFMDVTRDPRANHIAAKIRLKEDAEAAGRFGLLQVSDNTAPPAVETQNNILGNGVNMKSILKRRENYMDSNLQKRVRFEPECKNDSEEESEGAKDLVMETSSMEEATASEEASTLPQDSTGVLDYKRNASVSEEAPVLPQDSSGVPDYMRNPSKYTHYTFESSSDIDEESNQKAYRDFLNLLKMPNTTESQPDDTSNEFPKSVTFIAKRKPGHVSTVKIGNEFEQSKEDVHKEYMHKKRLPISIAAVDAQESEVCAMEEDEAETAADKSSSLGRPGRQYRTKASVDLDELVI